MSHLLFFLVQLTTAPVCHVYHGNRTLLHLVSKIFLSVICIQLRLLSGQQQLQHAGPRTISIITARGEHITLPISAVQLSRTSDPSFSMSSQFTQQPNHVVSRMPIVTPTTTVASMSSPLANPSSPSPNLVSLGGGMSTPVLPQQMSTLSALQQTLMLLAAAANNNGFSPPVVIGNQMGNDDSSKLGISSSVNGECYFHW